MANYLPIPKEVHIKRGSCCNNYCFYCPWQKVADRSKEQARSRANVEKILAALKSGEEVSIYLESSSLVKTVVLANRVTIHYRLVDP